MKITRVHVKGNIVINISIGDTDKPWTSPPNITSYEFAMGEVPENAVIGSIRNSDGSYSSSKVFEKFGDRSVLTESYEKIKANKKKFMGS